jgi:hypothetical protein
VAERYGENAKDFRPSNQGGFKTRPYNPLRQAKIFFFRYSEKQNGGRLLRYRSQ